MEDAWRLGVLEQASYAEEKEAKWEGWLACMARKG